MGEIVVTKTGEEPGARNLKVEVPTEQVRAAETKAASYYAKRVKLPGFRKGKVPLDVVRRRYRDAIRRNVIQEMVDAGWKAAVDQEGLQPIAEPQVRDLKFEDGGPISFELSVAVKPELELPRLGGFTITRKLAPVSEAMVDAQIEELRRQRAPWTPLEDIQPAPGDLVSVTVTPLEQGVAQEGRQYQLVLGEGQALPDVEDRLLQMRPGETLDTTVRFPDDFDDETKRGQLRGVRLELHEVKRQDLPALDDDFAREVGDFESLESLRGTVRRDLEDAARREADAEVRRKLLDEIISANAVEAPRPLVQRMIRAFAETYQVPDDQLEKFAGDFAPVAERQVRRDLILDHVAERENLKATEADVDKKIEEIAQRQNAKPAQVYASLQKAKRLTELERNLTEERVFIYLMEQSTVVDEEG